MGTICKIGEIQKHPNGKWHRKDEQSRSRGACSGCAYEPALGAPSHCPSKDGGSLANQVRSSIQDGGCDCDGAIWTAVPAPKKPKAKVPKEHVWEPKTVFAKFPPRTTRSDVEQMLRDAVDEINQLGAENAKLKNQIVSLKQKGAK